MSDNGRFTAKQLAAVPLLVRGDKLDVIAKATKTSIRTLQRWKEQPDFQTLVRKHQQKDLQKSLDFLRIGTNTALQTLARNMQRDAPPAVQVSAAKAWLDATILLFKEQELMEAIAELKYLLKQEEEGRY